MKFADLFEGHMADNARLKAQNEARRFGPCEDDYEVTAPYIGILPDESDHEDGSPLDFG